jgi:hypothetical protein
MQRINNRFLLNVIEINFYLQQAHLTKIRYKGLFYPIHFMKDESGKVNRITSRTFHNVSSFKS